MDKNGFCTIVTPDYLPYALTLSISLLNFQKNISLNILVTGDLPQKEQFNSSDSVELITINEICQSDLGKAIHRKYAKENTDKLRWSLKGVFLSYLLEKKRFEKIIYIDCDIFFYSDYSFLWKELDNYNILLTPHWRNKVPIINQENFDALFVGGLYNAGFIAVNKKGISALKWWAERCLEECIKDFKQGKYVDQTYLNLLPIYFDKVKILKHQGCNVAGWNIDECQRTIVNGKVFINEKHPIVFIHFSKETIWRIQRGNDVLLRPHLATYQAAIKQYRFTKIIDFRKSKKGQLIYWAKRKLKKFKNALFSVKY